MDIWFQKLAKFLRAQLLDHLVRVHLIVEETAKLSFKVDIPGMRVPVALHPQQQLVLPVC